MSAPVKQVGFLAMKSDQATTDSYVPIYGMDAIRLRRGQDWAINVVGPQSVYTNHWKGSQPVTYDINFELMVGWGELRTTEDLKTKIKLFHAMCSHRLGVDGYCLPPPRVQLLLAGHVNQIGFLADVGTELKPPWVVSDTGGSAQLTGISCIFTGKFWFAPGLGADGIVQIAEGNRILSSEVVAQNLYTVSI